VLLFVFLGVRTGRGFRGVLGVLDSGLRAFGWCCFWISASGVVSARLVALCVPVPGRRREFWM
jgi:hypothetical protein